MSDTTIRLEKPATEEERRLLRLLSYTERLRALLSAAREKAEKMGSSKE